MKFNLIASIVICSVALVNCGPKAFVKGDYDDVQRTNLLNDQWSETDMQKAVEELVKGMSGSRAITDSKVAPVVMMTGLQNKTSEHIDTQSILDMIRVELMRTGRLNFVDREAREDVANEYQYQNSGVVNEATKKGPGGQIGSDFIINGRLDSIVQEVGKDKSVYYKLTLNLTNLKTNVIAWSDYKQIRKTFKKKSIGL